MPKNLGLERTSEVYLAQKVYFKDETIKTTRFSQQRTRGQISCQLPPSQFLVFRSKAFPESFQAFSFQLLASPAWGKAVDALEIKGAPPRESCRALGGQSCGVVRSSALRDAVQKSSHPLSTRKPHIAAVPPRDRRAVGFQEPWGYV